MSRNGGRRPPLPKIAVTTAGASAEETAAIAAAIGLFLEEAAIPASPPPAAESAWMRAGLLENVGLQADRGQPRPWL